MADVHDHSPRFEDISDLLLVIAKDSGQKNESNRYHFLIASTNPYQLVSALRQIPAKSRVDLEEHITNLERNAESSDGISHLGLIANSEYDLLSHFSHLQGLEYHDLGSVSDKTAFTKSAIEIFHKYLKSKILDRIKTAADEYGLEQSSNILILFDASSDLILAYDTKERKSRFSAGNYLAMLVPDIASYHLQEIGMRASQKGGNREGLIALQCFIIDAVMREDYARATELNKMYERTPLR